MPSALKSSFLLDPDITFLNHGSFGACPKPVFEIYQSWQRRLENQPVKMLGREANALMAEARSALARFVNAEPDEVIFFPNPTTAVNMVARSLHLEPGDEVLTTDHEYGAMDRTWRYTCGKAGAKYIHKPVPLPVGDREAWAERFWEGVTPRTRVIFLSHITSPTALIFPIQPVIRRARERGILTIIDGAHAPGQIPLDLHALGADLYTGACHKWLCAPKGAAFLFARPEVQAWLDPLVVSWGYESEQPGPSQFIDYHEWQGTRDLSAFLSVPAAIRFQEEHQWEKIQEECHDLASQSRSALEALTGLDPIAPEDWFRQMFAVRLPEYLDASLLKETLYSRYKIEVPVTKWNDQFFLRVSVQAYNTVEDLSRLSSALGELLEEAKPGKTVHQTHVQP